MLGIEGGGRVAALVRVDADRDRRLAAWLRGLEVRAGMGHLLLLDGDRPQEDSPASGGADLSRVTPGAGAGRAASPFGASPQAAGGTASEPSDALGG